MKNSVCAVVVTYNRIDLLKQVIQALKSQTRIPDQILIVNNGSTDGTGNWLKKQSDIQYINQSNLGGAGGFNTGIKKAIGLGHTWIWCMDDDGTPNNNVLENLLIKAEKYNLKVICPGVIPSKNSNTYSFGYCGTNSIRKLKKIANTDGVIIGEGNFFNGVLMNKKIVETVGLPDKRFVIKGDEREYKARIVKHFNIAVDLNSEFYHPSGSIPQKQFSPILPSKLKISIYNSDIKNYYYIRNQILLSKIIRKQYDFAYILTKYFMYAIFNITDFENSTIIFKAIIDGIFNKFNRDLFGSNAL